jgi:hypothetical protein
VWRDGYLKITHLCSSAHSVWVGMSSHTYVAFLGYCCHVRSWASYFQSLAARSLLVSVVRVSAPPIFVGVGHCSNVITSSESSICLSLCDSRGGGRVTLPWARETQSRRSKRYGGVAAAGVNIARCVYLDTSTFVVYALRYMTASNYRTFLRRKVCKHARRARRDWLHL